MPDQNMKEAIFSLIYGIPFWEAVILLILTVITIFRRRLSPNDTHRSRKAAGKQPLSLQRSYSPSMLMEKYTMLWNVFSTSQQVVRTVKPGEQTHSKLNNLPTDILVHFLCYLETHEIIAISLTNVTLRSLYTSSDLWEQLWLVTYGTHWNSPPIKQLRFAREIYWDPCAQFGAPMIGWYHFYLLFEVVWMDWLLAGYNTDQGCLLAVDDAIYDVTDFLQDHPGSSETLTEGAGCDATNLFHEIGHSDFAEGLKRRLCVWDLKGQYANSQVSASAAPAANGRPRAFQRYTQDEIKASIRVPTRSRLADPVHELQQMIATCAMKAWMNQAQEQENEGNGTATPVEYIDEEDTLLVGMDTAGQMAAAASQATQAAAQLSAAAGQLADSAVRMARWSKKEVVFGAPRQPVKGLGKPLVHACNVCCVCALLLSIVAL